MTRCSPLARLVILCLLLLHLALSPAQLPSASASEDEPGSRLRIYLLTMGPGDEVWEKFGHNAIGLYDPDAGTDVAYNWGVFDFFQEGFYRRFIFGQMLYRMEAEDPGQAVAVYQHFNRSVWLQELNLSPRQKLALREFLRWNERPENREYRYDYYRDNCSTRVRDALDRALGGDLAAQLRPGPTGTTYRWHTRRITADNVPLYASLLFILGQPVDRPISAWDESFLPLRLMDHLRTVTVSDDAGRRVPLVMQERELFRADRAPERTGPPNWIVPFLALGLTSAGVLAYLASRGRRSRWARVTFVILATLWAFLIGGAGTFAAWGWLSTEHVAVYRNENILHFSPLALPLVVLIPLAARGWRKIAATARWLAIGTAASSVLGLVLQILPAFYQVNGEIIAWILPTHIAFAFGVWQATRKPATPSAPETSDTGTRHAAACRAPNAA